MKQNSQPVSTISLIRRLVGITGTNGKTTTVTLLYHLFMAQGYNCGLLSTIANYVGTRRLETANTTADPITSRNEWLDSSSRSEYSRT